jgi:MFS family permease
MLWATGAVLAIAFLYLIWRYVRGLRRSPRELALLFISMIIEYSAYGAVNLTFVLYLSKDCGLSDIGAGTYIAVWSMILTATTILVGAVCDAIGIKRTLLVGLGMVITARAFIPFLHNLPAVSVLSFLPHAIGIALMGPVISVGIKRYTTKEGMALGFALFYTLMNVGWAIGGQIFDAVRLSFGEHKMWILPLVGAKVSTYQIIFLVGLCISIPNVLVLLLMRNNVRMSEEGQVVLDPTPPRPPGGTAVAAWRTTVKAGQDTARIFSRVISEKSFWVYLFMLSLLVPVRLVFYHFHYTFPKYGIRVLGEGVKIGNIYSVLNPTMIVFLVPLVGWLTRKISSYKMMLIGTTVSASAIFIATMPVDIFAPLMHTWFGDLVLNVWLRVPLAQQQPVFLAIIFCVMVFTVGESIWSPRLMQFTAEIAPKGKEGSYISLSYLPYFGAKMIAGPMSGWLLATYVPEHAPSYPHHYLVWAWIGGMAVLSPLGLIAFHRLFHGAEQKA